LPSGADVIRYDKRAWVFAACLSVIAGYVDAIGFLKLGGYFVSFMSGNSTRAAVGIAEASYSALIATALILLFVAGVVIGSLVGHAAGRYRQQVALLLVAALLAAAAALGAGGMDRLAIAAMTLAMGAENNVFQRDGEVSIGVTYMTGTLVKAGQHIAAALSGRERYGWIPYLLLWFGLLLGAIFGALAYPHVGLGSLWLASAAAILLALFANHMTRSPSR
jgi:uncharacterized membrane protein YoaK (UPF0700 family)